ncbi:MAG: porin [Desulfuromonadales bacterium]|nr:porin [Desulfuromonadales bacterium]
MKKSILVTLGICAAVSLTVSNPCSAAFVVGGENGWQLTTDGIVDVFSYYHSTQPAPSGNRGVSLLDNGSNTDYNQRFGVGVGLLPSVVAFNIKAPTTNGIDSTVRVGIYPSISNGATGTSGNTTGANRFNTGPAIDFREIFYTAKGAYGELLAGRALNLYQGKNILTDMTLLTAGVVGGRANTVTLGHIASGYLYAGFGPQIRYTTPDLAGLKLALEIAEPYAITANTGKTNTPRVEAELSYAQVLGPVSINSWVSGLYQNATRSKTAANRPGQSEDSIGGAYGLGVGVGPLNLLGSGYGGRGLGMLSAQDGGTLGATATEDALGRTRLYWGFLLQATYKITPSIMLGANYGQSRQEKSDTEGGFIPMKNQESAVATVTYNLNKFTQFIAEYTYAQNTWHDSAKQHSNQFALGTMFYW